MSSSAGDEVKKSGTGKRNKNESDHGAAASSPEESKQVKRMRPEDVVNAHDASGTEDSNASQDVPSGAHAASESADAIAPQQVSTVDGEAWDQLKQAEDDLLRRSGLEDVFAKGKGSEIRKAIVATEGGLRAVRQIINGNDPNAFDSLYGGLQHASGISDGRTWTQTWGQITPVVQKAIKKMENTIHIPPCAEYALTVEEYYRRSRDPDIHAAGVKLGEQAKVAKEDNQAFLCVIAPTGEGKTLTASATPNAIRLVMDPAAGQDINKAVGAVSDVLRQMFLRDRSSQTNLKEPTVENLCSITSVPLASIGFLCYLLEKTRDERHEEGTHAATAADATFVCMNMSGTHYFPSKSIAKLAEYGADRVVILDELPLLRKQMDASNASLFFCNACRLAHVPVIVMGTEASGANLVRSAGGSRQEKDASWTHLLTRLLPFTPNDEQRGVIASVEAFPSLCGAETWRDTNPLFAEIALSTIRANPVLVAAGDEAELLQKIREDLIEQLHSRKPAAFGLEGLAGQFALHLDAHCEHTLPAAYITKHFARLALEPEEEGGVVKMTIKDRNDHRFHTIHHAFP